MKVHYTATDRDGGLITGWIDMPDRSNGIVVSEFDLELQNRIAEKHPGAKVASASFNGPIDSLVI